MLEMLSLRQLRGTSQQGVCMKIARAPISTQVFVAHEK